MRKVKILILGRALLPSIPSLGNLPPEVYKNIEDSYKKDMKVRFPAGMLIPGAPYSGRRYFALAFALAKIADVKFYGPGYPNYMESWLPKYGEIDVLDVIRRLYPNDYPDVVMQLSPSNAEGMISSFANFEKAQCLRVLWAADFHNDVSEPTIQNLLAQHAWDLIIKSWDVNNLTQYSQKILALGVPMEWVPFSIDPGVFKDYGLPKIHDVINMGSFNRNYYPLRVAMHEALVAHRDKIKYVCGYDFVTESNRLAGVMTDEYARIINQGKIYTTCTSTFMYPGLKLFEIMACLPQGSLVHGDRGIVDIATVHKGDRVMSEGYLTSALNIMHRQYDGSMYKIKALGMLEFDITPEHPILVADISKKYSNVLTSERGYCKVRKIENVSWKKAEAITYEDYLVFPKLKEEHRYESIETSYLRKTRPNKLIDKIPINEETAGLFGLYLAEGHSDVHVTYYFGFSEVDLINFVKETVEKYFPYKVNIRKVRTAVRLSFGGTMTARFFKTHFGSTALTKKIPDWILLNRVSILKSFVDNYLKGDGNKDKRSVVATTVSRQLALQLQLALSKLNVFSCITHVKCGGKVIIEGRTVNQHDRYLVRYSHRENSRKYLTRHLEDESHYYVPVKKISTYSYCGTVHNLNTASNLYTVSNLAVHNCNTLLVSDEPFDAVELGLKAGENYVRVGDDAWFQSSGGKDHPINMENWSCDKDKFLALVSHYLAHPDEVERISKNGYSLVHSRHTNDIRAKEFLQVLQKHRK